jgi:hypothetical protein
MCHKLKSYGCHEIKRCKHLKNKNLRKDIIGRQSLFFLQNIKTETNFTCQNDSLGKTKKENRTESPCGLVNDKNL